MSSDTAISVKNISKKYRFYKTPRDRLKQVLFGWYKDFFIDYPALKGVNIDIKKGETIGIIGRNGSGKSTLLQIICEVIKPTTGAIEHNGRIAALLELGAGFNPDYDGIENILLYGAILGLSEKEIKQKMDKIIEFSEIGDFIHQPIKTYSSGMVIRLAFSVIAHVDAEILVIDEALSVGDTFFVQKCMRFLRDFMEKGTVIFVSHDTGAVLNLCDRAVFLQDGEVKSIGGTEEVVRKYLEQKFKDNNDALVPEGQRTENESGREVIKEETVDIEKHYDMRKQFYQSIELRNDIKLEFPTGSECKQVGPVNAKISTVYIEDLSSNRLSWVVGGEYIRLVIEATAISNISSVIMGFFVKDRLGQNIFGDNSFLQFLREPISAGEGDDIRCVFTFQVPRLPSGNYAVDVAIAEGDQDSHTMHHWLYDAIVFESQCKSTVSGLVGIRIDDISLQVNQ